MIKPGEIQALANKQRVRDTQIEKDYILTWVLISISQSQALKENLIFKGGTALKKGYFPEYRFSEDLDFTFTGEEFSKKQLLDLFENAFNWINRESRVQLQVKEVIERNSGNLNFYAAYTGPLGGIGARKGLKIDISQREMLYFPPKELPILTNYSDSPKTNMLLFYDLGEIMAEKMRALMERTTPRDLYDLWYMLEVEGLDIEDYASAFQEKAVFKGLSPSLFVEMVWVKRNLLKRQWDFSLAHQMHDLPGFDEVWRDFGKHLRRFNKFINGSKAEEEAFEYGFLEDSISQKHGFYEH